ncbi:MAG: hypothetical protein ACTHJJ_14055 [Intrasporangium sp.]|uniref:hypothetical protein n=1 Tax=Intrasporangium sp. TaxID=1925024 RepID=UPI003F805B9E
MDWAIPPAPVLDQPVTAPDAHEVIVPAEERDEHHTWVNLERGVVHVAVPPERFGPAWDADPGRQVAE